MSHAHSTLATTTTRSLSTHCLWFRQPDAGKPNNEATKLAEKPHISSTLQQDVDYHACVHDLATSSTLAGTLPVDILSK